MCWDEGISRKCGGSRCVGMKVLVGTSWGVVPSWDEQF